MPIRFRNASLLLLTMSACAGRPAATNVVAFADAVSVTRSTVDDTLNSLDAAEVGQAYENAALGYSALPRRTTARIVSPLRPKTVAAVARGVLDPSFALFAEYADALAKLAGDDSLKPLDASVQQLAAAVVSGVKAAAPKAAIPAQVAADGSAAAEAIAHFIADRVIAADLAPIVRDMQPHVQALADLVIAVVGQDDSHGLRLALVNEQIEAGINRDLRLSRDLADRSNSEQLLRSEFHEELSNRDAAPTTAIFEKIVTATNRLVTAHAALVQPASRNAQQCIEQFIGAVKDLVDAYDSFKKQGG